MCEFCGKDSCKKNKVVGVTLTMRVTLDDGTDHYPAIATSGKDAGEILVSLNGNNAAFIRMALGACTGAIRQALADYEESGVTRDYQLLQ